jgi:hypothetical protein
MVQETPVLELRRNVLNTLFSWVSAHQVKNAMPSPSKRSSKGTAGTL